MIIIAIRLSLDVIAIILKHQLGGARQSYRINRIDPIWRPGLLLITFFILLIVCTLHFPGLLVRSYRLIKSEVNKSKAQNF